MLKLYGKKKHSGCCQEPCRSTTVTSHASHISAKAIVQAKVSPRLIWRLDKITKLVRSDLWRWRTGYPNNWSGHDTRANASSHSHGSKNGLFKDSSTLIETIHHILNPLLAVEVLEVISKAKGNIGFDKDIILG